MIYYKHILLFITVGFLLTFTACSDGPKPDEINIDEDLKCTRNGSPAPEWVCKNVEGDNIQTAVGQSDFSRIGENFMLREATVSGESAMQKVVYDYIDMRLSSIARHIGGIAAEKIDMAIEEIAVSVSEMKRKDYKQIKLWTNPTDSSIEVLMAIQNKKINKDVRVHVMHILKENDTVYNAYLSANGKNILDEFLPLN